MATKPRCPRTSSALPIRDRGEQAVCRSRRHRWRPPCHAVRGGAGRIGSKRLDPETPTTPRPAIAARACRSETRLPLPRLNMWSPRSLVRSDPLTGLNCSQAGQGNTTREKGRSSSTLAGNGRPTASTCEQIEGSRCRQFPPRSRNCQATSGPELPEPRRCGR